MKKRKKDKPEDVFLGIVFGSAVMVGLAAILVLGSKPDDSRR